jgi:hypothetical protein
MTWDNGFTISFVLVSIALVYPTLWSVRVYLRNKSEPTKDFSEEYHALIKIIDKHKNDIVVIGRCYLLKIEESELSVSGLHISNQDSSEFTKVFSLYISGLSTSLCDNEVKSIYYHIENLYKETLFNHRNEVLNKFIKENE